MTAMDFYLYTRLQQGCLAILIYIAYSFFSVKRRKTYVHKLFSVIIICSLFNLIFDIITVYMVNHLESVPLIVNRLFHTLFVGSIATVIFCTYLYVRSLVYTDVRHPLGRPLAIIPFVLALASIIFLPIEYNENPHTNYSGGPAVFAAYICIAFYFVRSFMLLILFRRIINRKKMKGIVTALISILSITSLQAVIHESLVSSMGIALLNLAFFFTVENPDATLIEELEFARRKADEANKAKSAFLANMSHEIRTPLNAVLGMDEIILHESNEPSIVTYAENIQNAGQTLLSIINDILDFSKVEEGKMEILPTQYELSTVIADILNMIRTRAERKGLELEIAVNEDIPYLLFGDDIRIKQCILNILTNSVKYTERGSVKLSVDFEKKDKEHILLQIHVSDTGIGIKEDDLAKLFAPFQRIEENRNRTIEGAGLGITITQQLLQLMGSELKVQSIYGRGSDFMFTLEQRVIRWEPLGDFVHHYANLREQQKKYHESFHAPKALILVVDDNVVNLTVFNGLLKKTKIKIDTATSGKQGLSMLAEKKYDIVFMDHLMPEMDGIETMHKVQEISTPNADTPFIALTANAISGAREMFISEGFADYLSKPVKGSELESMIVRHLPKEKVILESNPDFVPDPLVSLKQSEKSDFAPQLLQNMNNIGQKAFGIQFIDAIANCGGYEFFYDVIRDFHHEIQHKANLIERYAREEDFKNYTIQVHSLKSSARIIGAMQLHEAAKYLESCGNAENKDEIVKKTPDLLRQYRSYAQLLIPLLTIQGAGNEKKSISEEELKNAFDSIRELVQAKDFSGAQNVIEMLEEYDISADEKNTFQLIKEKLQTKDAKGVITLLNYHPFW
ncbi:MAG: response regulator [Treponema sp.]|nr:response regulator [Treponema sp.]